MNVSPEPTTETKDDHQTLQLSPTSLGVHNRSSGTTRHSRHQLVSSWIAAQSELPSAEDDMAAHSHNLHLDPPPLCTTPAIVLTTPGQVTAEATELVSAQKLTHPVHRGRGKNLESLSAGQVGVEQRGKLGTGLLGVGGRMMSIYPSVGLVDEPIQEEDEGEEESTGVNFSNAHAEALHATTEFQIPDIQIDAPTENPPEHGHQHFPGVARKRALSYPAEAPVHTVPLLELPSRQALHSRNGDLETEGGSSNRNTEETEEPRSKTRMGKFCQMAIMAKKWKKRSLDIEGASEEQQSENEALAFRQKKRPLVEVPRTLKLDLLEEAYPIVQRTYQMYMSELGPKHKLTESAKEHLQLLATQLGRT